LPIETRLEFNKLIKSEKPRARAACLAQARRGASFVRTSGQAARRRFAVTRTAFRHASGARSERGGKVSGNFKTRKSWRLEMASGVCFVGVSSVSNSGQWIR